MFRVVAKGSALVGGQCRNVDTRLGDDAALQEFLECLAVLRLAVTAGGKAKGHRQGDDQTPPKKGPAAHCRMPPKWQAPALVALVNNSSHSRESADSRLN